jgi:hypothetical protein
LRRLVCNLGGTVSVEKHGIPDEPYCHWEVPGDKPLYQLSPIFCMDQRTCWIALVGPVGN